MPDFGINIDPLGFLGGLMSQNQQKQMHQDNLNAQKEFAQNSIQWKVQDAKAAGLNPLAALGTQSYSFSPSYAGDTSFGNNSMSISGGSGGKSDPEAVANAKKRDELATEMLELQVDKARSEAQLYQNQVNTIAGFPDQATTHPAAKPEWTTETYSGAARIERMPDGSFTASSAQPPESEVVSLAPDFRRMLATQYSYGPLEVQPIPKGYVRWYGASPLGTYAKDLPKGEYPDPWTFLTDKILYRGIRGAGNFISRGFKNLMHLRDEYGR